MSTFKDHIENPKNFEKPYLFSTSVSYLGPKKSGSKATLYIDINNKNKIEKLSFFLEEMDSWKAYFSILSEVAKNKTIEEAREISWEDFSIKLDEELEEPPFIPFPMLLLNKAIDKYKGEKYNKDLMGAKSGGLICRCFCVSEGQILEVLKSNPYSKVKDITDQTFASAGCTNCLEDLENLIASFHENEQENIKIPSEVIGNIDGAILEWKVANGLENFYEISVKAITGVHIKIEITPENKKDDIKNALEIYLNQSLDFPFYLSF